MDGYINSLKEFHEKSADDEVQGSRMSFR